MKKILLTTVVMIGLALGAYASALTDYETGREAFEAKNYTTAIDHYNKAIKQNPKYAEAYYAKGEAEMELQQHDNAIKSFTKVITLNPKSADGYYGRGAANASKQNWAAAKKDLDIAVKYDPNNYEKYEEEYEDEDEYE